MSNENEFREWSSTQHAYGYDFALAAWLEASGRMQKAIDALLKEASEGMPGTPWRIEQQYVVDLRNWAVTRIARLKRELAEVVMQRDAYQEDFLKERQRAVAAETAATPSARALTDEQVDLLKGEYILDKR